MRGTTKRRKNAGSLESVPLRNPAVIALTCGTLFAVLMIFVLCSVRFPIDPSLVPNPYLGMCTFFTVVNICLGTILVFDCVRSLRRQGRLRILTLLSHGFGLAIVASAQLIVE